MITKILSTVTVLFGLIAILIIYRQRGKTGGVRLEKRADGRLRVVLVPVSRLIAYTAYGVGAVVCLCAALEEKKGDFLYGMTLGMIFLCAATYWLLRCLRWRVELSEEGVSCRGTLGSARVIPWTGIQTAAMLYEYAKASKEVIVQLDTGAGKTFRFPVPEQYAPEVKALIKKYPKVKFRSTQNKNSMNFKI